MGSAHLASPENGCKQIDPPTYDEEWDTNPIIFIKRGKCSFVTKAYYAQIVGAKMVVIIDNNEYENVDKIVMSDDGHGNPTN